VVGVDAPGPGHGGPVDVLVQMLVDPVAELQPAARFLTAGRPIDQFVAILAQQTGGGVAQEVAVTAAEQLLAGGDQMLRAG
jgi:hypothetical protein